MQLKTAISRLGMSHIADYQRKIILPLPDEDLASIDALLQEQGLHSHA